MITDTHAHMTALAPLSTIAIGVAGGQLPSGSVCGINLYTDGDKKETIQGQTHETYVGETHLLCATTKDETVRGVWTEKCHNAKTETVDGTVTQNFNAEHNLTVGHASVYEYKGPKEEKVGTASGGDYTFSVLGNKSESIAKNLSVHVEGDTTFSYDGKLNVVRGNDFHTIDLSNHFTKTKGVKADAHVGLKISISPIASIALDENLSISQGVIKSSANLVKLEYNVVNMSKNSFSTKTAFVHILK